MHAGFPCERFLQLADKAERPVMAVLYGTFGRSTACLKRFAHKFRERPHLIEIHATNETCRRKPRVCLQGELFENLRVREYNALLETMPKYAEVKLTARLKRIVDVTKLGNRFTTWVLSTGLEDNFSKKAYAKVVKLYRANWPYLIARSPVGDTAYAKGADFAELHTANAEFGQKPCIWNQDGLDGGHPEAREAFKRFSHCSVLIGWTKASQGIVGAAFIAPRKRVFSLSNGDLNGYGSILGTTGIIFK